MAANDGSNAGPLATVPFAVLSASVVDRSHFDWSSPCDLGPIPQGVVPIDKDALTKDMETFIRAAPRSWKEILEHYHGQPYQPIYHAFSALRPRLGRRSDAPWYIATRFWIRGLPTRRRHRRNSQTTIRATSRLPSRRLRTQRLVKLRLQLKRHASVRTKLTAGTV